MRKNILILIMLCLLPSGMKAFDFVVDGVYYTITNKIKRTVEVTHWEEATNEWGHPRRVSHHHCTHHHANEPLSEEHMRLIQMDKDASERARTAYVGKVVVPSYVRNKGIRYKVTGIGEGSFFSREQLTEISLPPTITYIGRSAFENCILLKEIDIPSSVERIGFAAFRRCVGIREMILPEKLTTIGVYSISHCRNLQYVRMSPGLESFPGNMFFNDPKLTIIELPQSMPPVVRDDDGLTMDFKKIQFNVPRKALRLYMGNVYWSQQNVQPIK